MRYNIPVKRKTKYCKKCHALFNDKNLRVRVNSKRGYVVYTCLECGYKKRYPYHKKKQN